MTKRFNIALVSDLLPDPNFTGGQVLERIIANTGDASFEVYWLNQSRLPRPDKLPDSVTIVRRFRFKQPSRPKRRGLSKYHKTSFSNPLYLARRFLRVVLLPLGIYRKARIMFDNSMIRFVMSSSRSVVMGFRLLRQLNAKDYDLVWMVLQGEKLAVIYYILSLFLNKKFILHQWDPIGWWLQNNNFGPTLTWRLENLVYAIERRSFATIVPSHTWNKAQLKRGLHSVRVDNFCKDDEMASRRFIKLSNPKKLQVVFIGQAYAFAELSELLERLAQHAYSIGRKLVLHCFGSGRITLKIPNLEIINHAYIDRNVLIERVSVFDIALLPYPMQLKFVQASRYSFPSKSRIYLAAGLPILSLCELDSSPHLFYEPRFGPYYLNVREAGDLSAFVERALSASRQDLRERAAVADEIIKENFSEISELAKFHALLEEAIQ
ncbi:MAG: hypothetical protein PHX43_04180 [Alphaproteobacteria bacterium]|nr:hypothetical protein [Alphaproteobacteria bacterium]